MELEELKHIIEGILFAAGAPVKTATISAVTDTEIESVRRAADALKTEYAEKKRGFAIIEIDGGYQICSNPIYHGYIREILGEQRTRALSNAAMEALAIIAYKQPITRGQIEKIRGVNSDGCVNRLYECGLIEEAGRLDAPGRPMLYKTTLLFLRNFGLRTLSDLPEAHLPDMPDNVTEQPEQ